MSNEETHRRLVEILTKLVDSDLDCEELQDLAGALGIRVSEFYGEPEIIERKVA